MNRTLYCAAGLLIAMLVAAPAWGQVPLIVGSVRDQQGAPIEGAVVSGRTATARRSQAATDAAGTFALHGQGVVCCASPVATASRRALVPQPTEPVVAIVRRYQALARTRRRPPTSTNLPYTHVESAIALRPFTLLAQSSTPYPGSSLSDRGLSPTGSLLIDDGVPNYDIVDGQSPYALIPANYEQSAVLQRRDHGFSYGDQAGGGIVALTPFEPGSNVAGRDARERCDRARAGRIGRRRESSSDRLATTRNRVSAATSPRTCRFPRISRSTFPLGSEQGRDLSIAGLGTSRAAFRSATRRSTIRAR